MEKTLRFKRPKKRILFIILFLFIALTAYATVALANSNTVKVNARAVNVRTGPGLSYSIMSQVFEGEQLNVLEEENEWYKVRISGDHVGWIASWLVDNTEISAATNQIGTITGKKVNVRSENSTSSSIIGSVEKGTQLTVLFQQGGWTQVQYLNQVAWVSSDYITVTAQGKKEKAATTVATEKNAAAPIQTITIRSSGTNIRQKPSLEGEVIQKADKGESFSYLGTEGDWYKIKLSNGSKGYVANWVVDLSANKKAAPTAKVNSLSEATIVIDAGHGGKDPGASAPNFYEKEVTLKTARALADRLRSAGSNVILTRSDDTFISLNDRVYKAHQAKADVFISLHYDSTEKRNEISGTTSYYYHEKDTELAKTVNRYLKQNVPLSNNGVRKGNYFVLRENSRPAILLELGYLNNDTDSQVVNSKNYRSHVVESVYQALNQYFTP